MLDPLAPFIGNALHPRVERRQLHVAAQLQRMFHKEGAPLTQYASPPAAMHPARGTSSGLGCLQYFSRKLLEGLAQRNAQRRRNALDFLHLQILRQVKGDDLLRELLRVQAVFSEGNQAARQQQHAHAMLRRRQKDPFLLLRAAHQGLHMAALCFQAAQGLIPGCVHARGGRQATQQSARTAHGQHQQGSAPDLQSRCQRAHIPIGHGAVPDLPQILWKSVHSCSSRIFPFISQQLCPIGCASMPKTEKHPIPRIECFHDCEEQIRRTATPDSFEIFCADAPAWQLIRPHRPIRRGGGEWPCRPPRAHPPRR